MMQWMYTICPLEWDADGDNKKIDKVPVLTKFEEYCEPKKNVLKL